MAGALLSVSSSPHLLHSISTPLQFPRNQTGRLAHRCHFPESFSAKVLRSACRCAPAQRGVGEGSQGCIGEVVRVLQSEEEEVGLLAASELVGQLDKKGKAALLAALFTLANETADASFEIADVNHDGTLSREEFANYAEAQAVLLGRSTRPLNSRQLFLLGLRQAIGNVGFGFTDNFIMIVAGDAIQNSIGTSLGLSTLMSAGLGNCVADLVGTTFREGIEGVSKKLMPDTNVSPQQSQSKEAWWAETVGASVGVTAGCVLGLAPLFVMGAVKDSPSRVGLVECVGSVQEQEEGSVTLAPAKVRERGRLLEGGRSKVIGATFSSSSTSSQPSHSVVNVVATVGQPEPVGVASSRCLSKASLGFLLLFGLLTAVRRILQIVKNRGEGSQGSEYLPK